MLNVNLSVLLLFKTLNIILENITKRGATHLVSEFGSRSGPSESESGCVLGPRASEFGRRCGRVCQNLDILWGPVRQNQAVVSALTIRLNAHLVGSFL